MISFDTKGERFSPECALRVYSVFCRKKKCTVSDVTAVTGVSKVTAGRVIRYLEKQRFVKRYSYRRLAGRGVRPTGYRTFPGTSCAVFDARPEELSVRIFSVPDFRRREICPRIRSDRPLSDKLTILRDECFPAMTGSVPEKRLLALGVIDGGLPCAELPEGHADLAIPDDVPCSVFRFAPDRLADIFFSEGAGVASVFLDLTEGSSRASVLKGGDAICTVRFEGADLPVVCRTAAELALSSGAGSVKVFSPFICAYDEDRIARFLSDYGAGELETAFYDKENFDISLTAAKEALSAVLRVNTENA